MKVQTDLRAGNVVNDAANAVNGAVSEVSDFVQSAYNQANALQQGAANLWSNTSTALFRRR